MHKTPHQIVKENFVDKKGLVDKLLGSLDKRNSETSESELKSRILRLSNKKLLRLYSVEQKIREKFGDKAKLVEHLLTKRREAGLTADESLKAKLMSLSPAALLDRARQKFAPPTPKSSNKN